MGLSPAAKAKQLRDSRDYKRDKRANSNSFVKKEKKYRKGYARKKYRQAKLAVEFMKANALAFSEWLQKKGTPVAPAATQPSHTFSPPPTTEDQPFEFPVGQRPDVYTALSKDGTPTAPYLERRRMSGVDTTIIRQLGL